MLRNAKSQSYALQLSACLFFGGLFFFMSEARKITLWKEVEATREGLEGKQTAVGLTIRRHSIFVALPCVKALFKIVLLAYDGKPYLAPVLDVGPWNEDDEKYVFGDLRPLAEHGIGKYRKPTNKAGIDLSDGLIRQMGIDPKAWGKRDVLWRLIEPQEIHLLPA